MVLVDQDAFLTELTKMYEASTKGSVAVTFKRNTRAAGEEGKQSIVRARCSTGKISTLVNARDVKKFQGELSNIMKVHMPSLKKRPRKKHSSLA